jgi:hypothetical protein
MNRSQFLAEFCRKVNVNGLVRISLKEHANFDCVFWAKGGCSVYEHRPLQCRSYPFWPANLDSRESWDDLEKECPGVNIGKLHTREEIETWLELRRIEPHIDDRVSPLSVENGDA